MRHFPVFIMMAFVLFTSRNLFAQQDEIKKKELIYDTCVTSFDEHMREVYVVMNESLIRLNAEQEVDHLVYLCDQFQNKISWYKHSWVTYQEMKKKAEYTKQLSDIIDLLRMRYIMDCLHRRILDVYDLIMQQKKRIQFDKLEKEVLLFEKETSVVYFIYGSLCRCNEMLVNALEEKAKGLNGNQKEEMQSFALMYKNDLKCQEEKLQQFQRKTASWGQSLTVCKRKFALFNHNQYILKNMLDYVGRLKRFV